MTNAADNLSEAGLHMVIGRSGQMIIASSDLTMIEKTIEGHLGARPFMDVDPLVVAQFMEGRMPWRVVADDDTWKQVAPAIQTLAQNLAVYDDDHSAPTYDAIPPDLPMNLAMGRGDVMEQHPQIVDIPLSIEISEVVQAAKNRRPVDSSLFREASLETSWSTVTDMDIKVAERAFQNINNSLEHGPRLNPLDFALYQQELTELSTVIEDHEPTNNASPAP